MIDETVAAIATPIGAAGIGIVRVSGSTALQVAEKVFRSKSGRLLKDARNQSLLYGHIVDSQERVIDEVLVSVMRGPHSFTAEDVVEINCHGGVVAVRQVLEEVLRAGAGPAGPGEFSKRAFLNGRIDLAQAESIMDLINAKTEKSLKLAVNQLEGGLSSEVRAIRDKIMEIMAHIEAGIDFPEHDVEELSRSQINSGADDILARVSRLISSTKTGKVFREGLKTVIAGKPNVGKSSLLNALLKEKRAIVTDIPGTTRDVIEEVLSIRGIPLKIVDTAGIRETQDTVEKIGVEKTKEAVAEADLVLFMVDLSTGITDVDRDIFALVRDKEVLLLQNKADIRRDTNISEIEALFEKKDIVELSAAQGKGLEQLEQRIEEIVYAGLSCGQEDVLVTNVRHRNSLEKSAGHIREVIKALEMDLPTDCMAIDLKGAWESLGEITGETLGEDLVDQIFSRFCIGK